MALWATYQLGRYHPRGLGKMVGRKILLERRLGAREMEVSAGKRNLKKTGTEITRQRLRKHTEELRRLRRRARQLRQTAQEPPGRLQEVEISRSKARKMLERMGHWRGGMGKR